MTDQIEQIAKGQIEAYNDRNFGILTIMNQLGLN